MSKSTTIVTTTTALSNIADAIRADAETSGKLPTKQRMLNSAAKIIAGEKHDWGCLTGAAGPIIQKGIPQRRLDDLQADPSKMQSAPTRPLWAADATAPGITVPAAPMALYDAEKAAYFASVLPQDALPVVETFSTDTEDEDSVQCMFDPAGLFADEENGFVPRSLWGAGPAVIDSVGRAYFAASSSETVNDLITRHIINWSDEVVTSTFKAFHLPHVVIVTPEYPEGALEGHDLDEERDEHVSWEHPIDVAFRVFIDEALDAEGMRRAAAQAEDFLLRLARFLDFKDPRFANIRVALPGADDAIYPILDDEKMDIRIVNHVLNIVHGGHDDAPSLSLWIDEKRGIAHLLGHSGSEVPLDGPMAPGDAPEFEAVGRSGHYKIFEADEIAGLCETLERILTGYIRGSSETHRTAIEDAMDDLLIGLSPYSEWSDEVE